MNPSWSHAVGLVIGYGVDALFGDPPTWHPVSGFGRIADTLEARMYADRRVAGSTYLAMLVGATAASGACLDRATRPCPALNCAVTALATWTVLGGRSLGREATLVGGHLRLGDLPAAREQVTHLVGRDPSRLGGDEITRATVESVAENTSDAVVAPLFWGGVAGPAGLLGYRAVNTLDAMVGHRTPRHRNFGWAPARFDDVVNLVPARLSALLVVAAAPVVGGRPRQAVAAWCIDSAHHPSPNAGPVEAAFAGALGITLGGVNVYGDVLEDRGTLGSGPAATPGDISRAVRLGNVVGLGALSVAAFAAIARQRRRR